MAPALPWLITISLFSSMTFVWGDDSGKSSVKNAKTTAVAPKEVDPKEEEFENWFTLSATGVGVDGNAPSFMRRYEVSRGFSGGIEDFHMERAPSSDTVIKLDGHGLFDTHDYLLKYEVEKEKVGNWSVGYKEFRTWYDGHGGFFPQNGQWLTLFDRELALDRGEAWFEGELTLPDMPIFGFIYNHEFRNGQKDSLLWGDSRITDGLGMRKISPSFRDINEVRDTFNGYVRHTIDTTDFKVGLKYETTRDNNRLYVTRHPTETIQRSITTRELQTSDSLDFYGSSETRINEKLLLSSGYSLRTLDTDIGGSFIYGPGYDAPFNAAFDGRQNNDSGFLDLEGGSGMKVATINLNAMGNPCKDVSLIAGVRAEREDTGGNSTYINTSVPASLIPAQTFSTAYNDLQFLNVAQSLEARYAGLPNWSLYANALWEEGGGTIAEQLVSTTGAGAPTISRGSELDRWNQKYAVGANWYPLSNLNAGTQYYHKLNTRAYRHPVDNTLAVGGDRYPAFIMQQDTSTDDVNLRVTWRPLGNVTTVSRYDFQYATIDSRMDGLDNIQTGVTTSHIFSEAITWNALSRLYFQVSANVALAKTETPTSGITGAVLEAKNNYFTTLFTTGFALDKKTDLTATYTYYQAMNNYYDSSVAGLPYGSAGEENSVVLSLIRRINDRVRLTAKYGFFSNRDQLYGDFTNYDAHMLYTGVQVGF